MQLSKYVALLCLVVLWMGVGCAPKQPDPPFLSEGVYHVKVRVEPSPDIWLTPPVSTLPRDYHGFGVVYVEVTDAQGQPVDGVSVNFQLDPGWAQHASLTPTRANTRAGLAHAVFTPDTSGVVQVEVRVDNVRQRAQFLVHTRSGPGSASGGPFGGGMPAPRSAY
jgi:hypothetical protein